MPTPRKMLDQATSNTRNGRTEARRALHALRAKPLEDLGLVLALNTRAESVAARAGLNLDRDIHNHLEHLAPDVEQCIYRVVQEALTNVARHADARSLRVALACDNGPLTPTIVDDGCGCDPAAVNGTHYGLRGLRERAEMIGASLEVYSRPEQGTTVRLELRKG